MLSLIHIFLHVVVAVIDLGLGRAVAVNFVEARGAVGKERLFLFKALAVVVADLSLIHI